MNQRDFRLVMVTAAVLLWSSAWAASFDVTPGQLRSVPPNFPLKVEVQLTHTGAAPAFYTLYASEHGEQIPIRTSRLRKFVMSRKGQSLKQTVQFLGTQQRQRTVKVCARVQEKGNPSTLDLCSDVAVK
jgi:hypothetical protein